jgi:hypothetical protein
MGGVPAFTGQEFHEMRRRTKMAEPHNPNRHPDPRHDPQADPKLHHSDPVYDDRLHARPADPAIDPAYDPAQRVNDPVLSDRPMASSGRGGLIAAGIVAALLVIAVIAFTSGTTTDPGTTAVIPDQTEDTAPAPAPAE